MDINTQKEIVSILDFLKESEKLKDTLRQCWTSEGKQESTAEHTWRLSLMVMLFSNYLPEINTLKLLKMTIIHDLAELVDGDIPAVIKVKNKSEKERKNLVMITKDLPTEIKNEIIELWDDYENKLSIEAKIAKALDKLETMTQHNTGVNPNNFNYEFNLTYGLEYTNEFNLFKFIRNIVDEETILKIEQEKKVA